MKSPTLRDFFIRSFKPRCFVNVARKKKDKNGCLQKAREKHLYLISTKNQNNESGIYGFYQTYVGSAKMKNGSLRLKTMNFKPIMWVISG